MPDKHFEELMRSLDFGDESFDSVFQARTGYTRHRPRRQKDLMDRAKLLSHVQQGTAKAKKHQNEALAVIAAVNTGLEIYGQITSIINKWRLTRSEREKTPPWTLSISDDDDLFYELSNWLNKIPLDQDIHEWSAQQQGLTVKFDYELAEWTKVLVEGVSFAYKITSDPNGARADSNDNDEKSANDRAATTVTLSKWEQSRWIYMSFDTETDLDWMKNKLRGMVKARHRVEFPPTIASYGAMGWRHTRAPLRSIDSVVLPAHMREQIITDIENFLESEEFYVQRGLTWHRGIMLYGPPGTGKTSLVKALAHYFSMDVYFISLNDVKSDTTLAERMAEIRKRSLVLFEDIDACKAATNREVTGNPGEQLTMTGLLNVLDGMFTPHGTIKLITTNHPERLDPAIKRPGRIDLQLHLDYAGEAEIGHLFTNFYGRDLKLELPSVNGLKVTGAEVTEVFKRHLHDADEAELDLIEFVNSRRTN